MVSDSDIRENARFGVIATLAFALFCVLAAWLVASFGALPSFTFFDLTVLGLACLRLIHLVSYDKILEPLRAWLETRRSLLAGFVECLWCTGMWAAVMVVTLYCLGRWGQVVVFVLAVAALGSLLQVISRAVAGCAVEPGG